ncbi:hypothetical protein P5V15_008155 [Pogonomyrmex californicus]
MAVIQPKSIESTFKVFDEGVIEVYTTTSCESPWQPAIKTLRTLITSTGCDRANRPASHSASCGSFYSVTTYATTLDYRRRTIGERRFRD